MDHRALFKQMINLNKAVFDNSFKAMELLQHQTEKMNGQLLEKAGWFPEEGKKAVNEWTQAFRKGREEYKKAIDQSFVNLQKFFRSED